jgi:hypothetical protein
MKIEIRIDCKQCGGKIVHNRFRTYCSNECRIKANNKKYAKYNTEYQRIRRKKIRDLQEVKKVV